MGGIAGLFPLQILPAPDAEIKVVQVFAGEPVCFPIRKTDENADLLQKINEVLEGLRNDGTLAALSVKYFGEDLTKE